MSTDVLSCPLNSRAESAVISKGTFAVYAAGQFQTFRLETSVSCQKLGGPFSGGVGAVPRNLLARDSRSVTNEKG